MKDYKAMLIERHRKALEAQPLEPEKALDHIQYLNRMNVRAWRDRMHAYSLAEKI